MDIEAIAFRLFRHRLHVLDLDNGLAINCLVEFSQRPTSSGQQYRNQQDERYCPPDEGDTPSDGTYVLPSGLRIAHCAVTAAGVWRLPALPESMIRSQQPQLQPLRRMFTFRIAENIWFTTWLPLKNNVSVLPDVPEPH